MNDGAAIAEQLDGARLLALHWLQDGCHLGLAVTLAGGGAALLQCQDIAGLAVDLVWRPGKAGTPVGLNCDIERTATGRWSLHWGFPPLGLVSLECRHLQLVVGGEAAAS
jgi:hypothetical protein